MNASRASKWFPWGNKVAPIDTGSGQSIEIMLWDVAIFLFPLKKKAAATDTGTGQDIEIMSRDMAFF